MPNSADVFKQNFDKSIGSIPKLEPEVMMSLNKMKDDVTEEEILKGGLADNKSLEDLAKKHNVDLEVIKIQFEMGIKKEIEHTKNKKEAEEIAMDHLSEDPKYYTKLNKMEKSEVSDSFDKSAKKQFTKDLQSDPDYIEFKKNSKFMDRNVERSFGVPNVVSDDPYIKKKKYSRPGKEENNEATGSGSSGAYSAPLFSGEEPKKVETTEATGSGSVGAYESPAAWAKSTKKKDWRGKSHTQIPGGAFVSVKKKCKSFPYCNKGEISALHIYENEVVKEAIESVSKKLNINETTIKAIIEFELEKTMKQSK